MSPIYISQRRKLPWVKRFAQKALSKLSNNLFEKRRWVLKSRKVCFRRGPRSVLHFEGRKEGNLARQEQIRGVKPKFGPETEAQLWVQI